MTPEVGERIIFTPKKGRKREGVVAPGFVDSTTHIKVKLNGDPFPVDVLKSQVSGCKNVPKAVQSKKVPKVGAKKSKKNRKGSMSPDQKSSAKALRKQAMALGVKGWEDMTRDQMKKAIKKAKKASAAGGETKATAPASKPASKPAAKATKAPAKKTITKKAPAKKAVNGTKAKAAPKKDVDPNSDEGLGLTFAKNTPPKPLPDEGVNPFRKSSNLFRVAALLLKGGKRKALAERLSTQVDLHPYSKTEDVDLEDFDKRLLLGAQTMRDQFGFGIQRTGRGLDNGTILVFRPGGPKDPRGKSAGRKGSKSATKKAAGKARK